MTRAQRYADAAGPATSNSDGPLVVLIANDLDVTLPEYKALDESSRLVLTQDNTDGLDAIAQERPDVVVCGVGADGAGCHLLSAIRADPSLTGTPVLMLGAADDPHRVELLRSGADDYLAEPFDPDELRLRIDSLAHRRRGEEGRRRAQARLDGLLDSSPDAIVVVDSAGRIVLANSQLANLLGYDQAELPGLAVDALVPEAARRSHAAHRARFAANAQPRPMGAHGMELAARRKDGTEVPVDISLTPIHTPEGPLVSAVVRDATARRGAEARLRLSEARASLLAAVADALPVVSEDPAKVLETVAEQLTDYPGDTCCVLHLAEDGERLLPVAWHHRDNSALAAARKLVEECPNTITDGPAGVAWRSGEAVLVERVDLASVCAQLPAEYRPWLERFPVSSVVYAPLRAHQVTIGLLMVQRHLPAGPYGPEEVAFVREAADRAALAYENARLERRVLENQKRFRSAFHDAPIGMALVGLDEEQRGRLLDVNRALCVLLGYQREHLLGRDAASFAHSDEGNAEDWVERVLRGEVGQLETQLRFTHAAGHTVWVRMSVSAVRDDDGTLLYTVNHYEDVTATIEAEERLSFRALHDLVTGLPNRLLLRDRLEHGLAQLDRSDAALGLLFVDLDRFKQVNDTFGHAVGDAFLVEVSRRVALAVRPHDTVARLGGDEFAVVCTDVRGEEDVSLVATRILEALALPIQIDNHELQASASIGIALATSCHQDADELLEAADAAMYRAKAAGRARYELYTDEVHADLRARSDFAADLRDAIDHDRLRLAFQPVFDLATGRATGVEALLRIDHPRLGRLEPGRFLPLAEETGLIVPMGYWVLEQACRRQVELRRLLHTRLAVSVNLSARQLEDANLVGTIAATLGRTEAEPGLLSLEMPETIYREVAQDATTVLERITGLGVGLAIDDFGTGYSSLVDLQRLPADTVKVDRSFVAGLGKSTEDTAFVTGIVGLAHTLGLRVVAEGVESAAQHERLRELGCDLAQGHYYARPMPFEALYSHLATELLA